MPHLGPWRWALAVLSVVCAGIAKSGIPGLGILAVPLMVGAAGSARAAAGWLLPTLCLGDAFAVVLFRRHAEARRLFGLLPWVAVGMAGGYASLGLPDLVLRRLVAGVVLAMIALHLVRLARARAARAGGNARTSDPARGPARAAAYGCATGFATTVANAAGPVMNLYLLAQNLPKDAFVATGAWFFFIVNLSKLPLYAARGMITTSSLVIDLVLAPAVAVGALLGRALFRRIPQRPFELTVFTLTAVAALLLFLPPGH